jgi:hypothetical protein
MEFPENCIKGIPHASFVRDGWIGSELFYFKDRDLRLDGWVEQSINWQDDENAVGFTLRQVKKETGEFQFKAGVAVLPRVEIDRIRSRYAHLDMLSYERQPLEDNYYHGNILLQRQMLKMPIMRQIAGALAMYAQYVPREEDEVH